MESNRPPMPESYVDEDLSLKGEKLKGFVFGAEGLVADWYWMRALLYIGDKIVKNDGLGNINLENLKPLNPRLLYPLLDDATSLDPQFIAAYSYGAILLPTINPKQAIAIAEKGIKNNPDQWRLYQHLGFIYWRLKDYKKAAEVYEKGSKIKGAPAFFGLMTAKMQNEGGSRDTARQIYTEMYRSAKNSQTKENARLRLMQLDSLDERDAIQAALDTFKKSTNRCAKSWQEIFSLLQKTKLPNNNDFRIDQSGNIVDPSGVPYALVQKDCKISIDFGKSKIPRM